MHLGYALNGWQTHTHTYIYTKHWCVFYYLDDGDNDTTDGDVNADYNGDDVDDGLVIDWYLCCNLYVGPL